MPDIHERIKLVRKHYHLTQQELADKLNISRTTVFNWENGQNVPLQAMLEKIARVLDVNILYLTGDSDIMIIPPDEDEEIIDRVMHDADPMLKALLIGIVKKPDGWRMLA